MLETHIKILASIYTAVLMAVIAYVLVYGGFEIKADAVKGKVIQATMVDISQIKSRSKPKAEPKQTEKPKKIEQPKKKPPVKEEPKKKEPVKVKPPKKDPPIIPKKQQPKVDIKAQEIERKKRQERKKKLERIQQLKKQKQRETKQAEQDLKDLTEKIQQEVNAPKKVENIGTNKGNAEANELNQMMARYQIAVISSVERQWNKPVSSNNNLVCHVNVRQMPGGGVIEATIASPCNANNIVKKSILAAIHKADPLPYKGFEKAFSRTATFIFQPNE